MGELKARLVMLQFSFSNPDVIPSSVRRRNRETLDERIERKSHSNGVVLIEPTPKCSLVDFLHQLEELGYELVDAFYKARIDGKDPRARKTYHTLRFVFVSREFVDISEEFRGVRGVIRAELQSICENSLWRVRAFDNPFYKNGEEVPGERTLSINLEAREPLFRPDGQPVAVWQKDEYGQWVGDAPLPLKADYRLHVADGIIRLED